MRKVFLLPNASKMKWLINIILAIVSIALSWVFTKHETFLHLFYFLITAFIIFWAVRAILAYMEINIDPFED